MTLLNERFGEREFLCGRAASSAGVVRDRQAPEAPAAAAARAAVAAREPAAAIPPVRTAQSRLAGISVTPPSEKIRTVVAVHFVPVGVQPEAVSEHDILARPKRTALSEARPIR